MQPQLLFALAFVAGIVAIAAWGKADKKKEDKRRDDHNYYGNDYEL